MAKNKMNPVQLSSQNADGTWNGNTSHKDIRRIRSLSIAHTICADEFGSRFDDLSDYLTEYDAQQAIDDFDSLEFLDDITGIAIAVPVYCGDNSKVSNL